MNGYHISTPPRNRCGSKHSCNPLPFRNGCFYSSIHVSAVNSSNFCFTAVLREHGQLKQRAKLTPSVEKLTCLYARCQLFPASLIRIPHSTLQEIVTWESDKLLSLSLSLWQAAGALVGLGYPLASLSPGQAEIPLRAARSLAPRATASHA